MKIAFLVGTFPKLSETFILNQITGLIDRGHEVDIFADTSSDEAIPLHGDVCKYGLQRRTVHFCGAESFQMPANRIHRLLKASSLFLRNFARRPTCLLNCLNFVKYGKESASLSLLYKAVTFLGRGHYDVLYCHFGSNGLLGAMLKDVGAVRSRLVTVFHGADMSRSIRRGGRSLYNRLFRHGDLFLPVSRRWRDELIALGCEEGKIVVHRMGIDLRKFAPRLSYRTEAGKIIVLTVGRMVEKKGIRYGISAIRKVLERYPDLEYRIVGDGPLRTELEEMIRDFGLGAKVRLLGGMPQERIIGEMDETDIFLAPSVTAADGDQEGIPVVLMEAMAKGIPVVSTRHSAIPELVRDGESGLLAEEGDADGLAERILLMIERPDLRMKMGREGRSFVEREYDINKLNDRLVGLYTNLFEGIPENKAVWEEAS